MSEPQSTGTSPPTPPDAGAPAKGDELEFLRADFGHVAESLLANEELGEKRVTFFTTLVCAVLGGIGFLTTELKNVGRSRLRGGGRDLRRCAQLSAPRRSCHALISW